MQGRGPRRRAAGNPIPSPSLLIHNVPQTSRNAKTSGNTNRKANRKSGRGTPESVSESTGGWVVSLLFWLCLFCAVLLYGSVALAPKFLTYLELHNVYYNTQVRLVGLERQVEYLGKVAAALEAEPEFAAELARIDFDATKPGDRRILVQAGLCLDAREPGDLATPPPAALPWYTPLVRRLAEDQQLRRSALLVAAIITIASFTFLQDVQRRETSEGRGPVRQAARRLLARYAAPHSS